MMGLIIYIYSLPNGVRNICLWIRPLKIQFLFVDLMGQHVVERLTEVNLQSLLGFQYEGKTTNDKEMDKTHSGYLD